VGPSYALSTTSELLGDEGIALLDKAAKKLGGLSADR